MSLQFWPGSGYDAHRHYDCLGDPSGRSAWFVGMLVLLVSDFAMTLYLLPPRVQ